MTFIFVQFSNQGFFICGSFKLNFNKLRNYLMKHIAAGCCPRQALESCWDTVDAIHMLVQTKFSLSYTVVVLPTRFKWPTYIFLSELHNKTVFVPSKIVMSHCAVSFLCPGTHCSRTGFTGHLSYETSAIWRPVKDQLAFMSYTFFFGWKLYIVLVNFCKTEA